MKFIEKEDNRYADTKVGDFVLFASGTLGLIIDRGRGFVGIVLVNSGAYYSYDYEFDCINDVVAYIKEYHPTARFIKHENIEIREV